MHLHFIVANSRNSKEDTNSIIYCTYVYIINTHTTYWMFEPKKPNINIYPNPKLPLGAEL